MFPAGVGDSPQAVQVVCLLGLQRERVKRSMVLKSGDHWCTGSGNALVYRCRPLELHYYGYVSLEALQFHGSKLSSSEHEIRDLDCGV